MAAAKKTQSLSARVLSENFISLLIVSALLIFGAAYLLYFKAEVAKLRQGGEFDAARLDKELLARRESLQKLKDAVAAMSSISRQDSEKIDRLLPVLPDEPLLAVSLSTIARDAGLTLLTFDASVGLESKTVIFRGLKMAEVTIGLGGGDYNGFKVFLEAVEKNIRLMDIVSIAYSPAASAYSIRLLAYYLE